MALEADSLGDGLPYRNPNWIARGNRQKSEDELDQ
jgi:hypothetical protein